MTPEFLNTPSGRRIAYHLTPGIAPIVFLGGFKSDMGGTKALFLQDWAAGNGRGVLRLDYSGHGASAGRFQDGCIGDWAEDALAVITRTTTGRITLVGSSMGGWISLLLARMMAGKIAGLVGIAAAPDFTEDGIWAGFSAGQKADLLSKGQVEVASQYDDGPYVITKKLIEDGRRNLVLRTPLALPFPVRLLQGTADRDVDMSVALRLLDHARGDDIRLTLVKGADHRFSTDQNLRLIGETLQSMTLAAQKMTLAAQK